MENILGKIPGLDTPLNRDVSDSDKLLYLIGSSSTDDILHGRKKLTKLAFFTEHWIPEEDLLSDRQRIGVFDFIIYKYGPFSREMMDLFDDLKQENLIEESRHPMGGSEIRTTEEGKEKFNQIDRNLPKSETSQISRVTAKFGDKRGGELENLSLEYLGISQEEKHEYMGMPVDVVISENQ